MKEEVLCSVLISCYNHEKFIEDAIEGVYASTYPNIEIIICDDCSSDNSWQVIQRCLQDKKNRFVDVKLIRHEKNTGVIDGLLEMLEVANGELIKLMGGDDFLGRTYLEVVVNAYENSDRNTAFVTNGFFIDENQRYDELSGKNLELFYKEVPDFNKETLFQRLYWKNIIFGVGCVIPRVFFEKYGTYDRGRLVDDWNIWLKWSATGKAQFEYIDKPLVYYRRSASSMTSNVQNEGFERRWLDMYECCENVIDKYGKYFSRKEYVRRKWEYLKSEWYAMLTYNFGDGKKLLNEKFCPFIMQNWKYIHWKQHVYYYQMKLTCFWNNRNRRKAD